MTSALSIVITGGTSGIGLATALGLARDGHRVTVVGRDRERGLAAVRLIDAESTESVARFIQADLSSLDAVTVLADTLRAVGPLDVLINNVGGLFRQRTLTADGIESTFAMSYLHTYYLTELLLPAMTAAGTGRIVNITSAAAKMGDKTPLDQDDVAGSYFGFPAYGRAKLAVQAFTVDLASRLEDTGVTAVAVDPGPAPTEMADSMRADLFPFPARLFWPLIRWNLGRRTIEQAATAPIHAATSPEVVSGTVVSQDGETVAPVRQATDPEVLRKLAALSKDLAPV